MEWGDEMHGPKVVLALEMEFSTFFFLFPCSVLFLLYFSSAN